METSQRLACDTLLVQMRHAADGAFLDVGRKTRTIPPSTRRALAARDTNCRFPGCTSRRCDAHHLQHWADGGATNLDNLVLLCHRHHRAVHEDGFDVSRDARGEVTFTQPNGKRLQPAPAPPPARSTRSDAWPADVKAPPVWGGSGFDVAWASDVVRGGGVQMSLSKQRREEGCGSCGDRSSASKELVGALPA